MEGLLELEGEEQAGAAGVFERQGAPGSERQGSERQGSR